MKVLEAEVFVYHGGYDPRDIFRWGVRVKYANHWLDCFPKPYQAMPKDKCLEAGKKCLKECFGVEA